LEFNQRLIKLYPNLFKGGEPTPYSRKWGEYASLAKLAGDKFERIDRVAKENVHKCLMFLEYLVDKNEEEKRQYSKKMKR